MFCWRSATEGQRTPSTALPSLTRRRVDEDEPGVGPDLRVLGTITLSLRRQARRDTLGLAATSRPGNLGPAARLLGRRVRAKQKGKGGPRVSVLANLASRTAGLPPTKRLDLGQQCDPRDTKSHRAWLWSWLTRCPSVLTDSLPLAMNRHDHTNAQPGFQAGPGSSQETSLWDLDQGAMMEGHVSMRNWQLKCMCTVRKGMYMNRPSPILMSTCLPGKACPIILHNGSWAYLRPKHRCSWHPGRQCQGCTPAVSISGPPTPCSLVETPPRPQVYSLSAHRLKEIRNTKETHQVSPECLLKRRDGRWRQADTRRHGEG